MVLLLSGSVEALKRRYVDENGVLRRSMAQKGAVVICCT